MNLVDLLTQSGGQDRIGELAKSLNLGSKETGALIDAVGPALLGGIKKQTSGSGGIEGLARALQSGGHQKYLEQPGLAESADGVADGNRILGHLFGSKDVSRNVAAKAAQTSGVDSGLIKKALPMLAGLAMGAISKKSDAGSGLGGLLPGLLGGADDGFGLDDVMGLAKKLF
jgi:hypothetical protein